MSNVRILSFGRGAAAIAIALATEACSDLAATGGRDEPQATVASALSASCAATSWNSCRASVVPPLTPGDVVDVARFDASSEPGDDADALQAAICCAHAMAVTGGTVRAVVNFGSGSYELSRSLRVMPGLTLQGSGASLRYTPATAAGSRAITTEFDAFVGAVDSLPLILEDFVFDGADSAMAGPGVWLSGGGNSTGKLVAIAKNLTFKSMPSDALVVGPNVSVHIQNITAKETGGAVLAVRNASGPSVRVFVDNLLGLKQGSRPGNLHVEGNGRIFLNNVDVDGSVFLNLTPGVESTLLVSNLHAPNGPFGLRGSDATVRISNSLIGTTEDRSEANAIALMGDFVFSRTTFVGHEVNEGTLVRVLNVYGGGGSRLELNDCTFRVDSSVEPSDTLVGIYLSDFAGGRTNLIIRGGVFESSHAPFDDAIRMLSGNLIVQRTVFKGDASTTAVTMAGQSAAAPATALVDGIITDDEVGCVTQTQTPFNSLTHRDIHVPRHQACAMDPQARHLGQRILFDPAPPSQFTPCVLGDLHRREPIPTTAGEVVESLCVAPRTTTPWRTTMTLP